MDTITLKSLYFRAKHGYHDFEREQGNEFEVDIVLGIALEEPGITDDLTKTIDYSQVYGIVQQVMNGASVKLLETLADNMGKHLLHAFPQMETLTINIRKLNPPLSGPCAYSEISRTWQISS